MRQIYNDQLCDLLDAEAGEYVSPVVNPSSSSMDQQGQKYVSFDYFGFRCSCTL